MAESLERSEDSSDLSMLDELLCRYYRLLLRRKDEDIKIGDFLKMLEMRRKMAPADSIMGGTSPPRWATCSRMDWTQRSPGIRITERATSTAPTARAPNQAGFVFRPSKTSPGEKKTLSNLSGNDMADTVFGAPDE